MSKQERGWLLPPMAVLLALGILLGRVTESLLPAALGCFFTLAAVFVCRGDSRLGPVSARFVAVLVFSFCLGSLCGQIAFHPAVPEERACGVTGIVSDEIRPGENGQYRTVLTHVTLDGQPVSSGAYWTFYADEYPADLKPGVQVSLYGDIWHPDGASNPDGYDFREELLRRGVTFGVYGRGNLSVSPAPFTLDGFTAALRSDIAARLTDAMGKEAGGYAAAMLLGLRTMVSGEDRAAFSRLGIAHVLAVSGFHTGILVAFLAFLFRLLHIPHKGRLVLYAVFLAFYSALCGMNQPVIRASALVILSLTGRLLRRPREGLHLLSAVWILMLIISPVQLTGLSFQLSFGAMLGLVLITPRLHSLHTFRHAVPKALWETLCTGIGAQFGILLPELYAFQELPLLSLLINIPVSFVASGMISLYWIVLLLLPFPVLCFLPAKAAAACTRFFTGGIRFLGSLDGITLWTGASNLVTCVGVLLLFVSFCVYFRFRTRTRLVTGILGLLITVLSVIPFPHTTTEYIQFSVGNADAAVLWDRDTVICIDTGYDDGVLASFLHRHRLTPDAVILTHLHADHAFGIGRILEEDIPIPVCYLPAGAEKCETDAAVLEVMDLLRASGAQVRPLSRGDTLPVPSGQVRVLWPEDGRVRPGRDANLYSLALLMEVNGVRLLQAGDLDGAYEGYAAVKADLLKAAHHGSVSSTLPETLTAIDPSAILLSCGTPSKHASFAARCSGFPVFSTARSGALTVHFGPGAGDWTIEPYLTDSTQEGDETVDRQ